MLNVSAAYSARSINLIELSPLDRILLEIQFEVLSSKFFMYMYCTQEEEEE